MTDHQPRRATKSWVHRVSAAPDAVFPLLCPQREYDWIEYWDCDIVFSESGLAENNCIFKTHPSDSEEDIWTVSRHEPEERRIEFVVVNPVSHVQKLDLWVEDAGNGACDVHWTRTCTSLTQRGDQMVDGLTGADHDEKMALVGRMLEHYCTTGGMLRVT